MIVQISFLRNEKNSFKLKLKKFGQKFVAALFKHEASYSNQDWAWFVKIWKLFTVFFENHDFCKIQQLILTEKKETKLIVETL